MTGYAESLLLQVQPGVNVRGACHAAGEFLTFRSKRVLGESPAQDSGVIAVWIDACVPDVAPDGSDCACAGGTLVRESVGVNGLWTLYWLHVPVMNEVADMGSVRERLASVLLGTRTQPATSPRFCPVFDPAEERVDAIRAECQRLTQRFPGVIGTPIVWNRATGTVRHLDVHDYAP